MKNRSIKDQVSVALDELGRVDESVARLLAKLESDDLALTDEKAAVLASLKDGLTGTLESVTRLLEPPAPTPDESNVWQMLQAQYESLAS